MGSLRDLPLKRYYSSDEDDILSDFYLPALAASTEYKRFVGFFSPVAFALAARGILGLIQNGGTMQLVVVPKFSSRDLEKTLKSYASLEDLVAEVMLREIESFEEEFVRDHVFVLAWMLAQKRLAMKVAVPLNEAGREVSYEEADRASIFHRKIGILGDVWGNVITFRDSMNETSQAWIGNIEKFEVFRNWEEVEKKYVETDVEKFNHLWNNVSWGVRVMEIPEVVQKKLISIAPEDFPAVDFERWYQRKKASFPSRDRTVSLFKHQREAVKAWLSKNGRGILEMATGTGKTYTAMGCLKEIWQRASPLVVVITFPKNHLLPQWEKAIQDFGLCPDALVAVNREDNWKKRVYDVLTDVAIGHKKKVIFLISHKSFSSEFFCEEVVKVTNRAELFVVADEVHGLGAPKLKKGLLDCYCYRLGLSATPERYFDVPGTMKLLEYFGGVVFRFTLKDAITTTNPETGETYLTPYDYFLKFVPLERDEVEKYFEFVSRITNLLRRIVEGDLDEELEELIEQLRFKKAKIVKAARSKLCALGELVEEIGIKNLHHTLVYCDEYLLKDVVRLFQEREVIVHRFTMREKTLPEKRYGGLSEREFLIQKFAEGKYKVLVAIKCLDEGVDVPPARRAILMSSSGNPREFIQRIGRVLRRYSGKTKAQVYDMVTYIPLKLVPPEFWWIEKKLLDWEFERCLTIAQCADNSYEVKKAIFEVWERSMRR